MQRHDRDYLIAKNRSESLEDLIGRFLFDLIHLQNGGNAQISALASQEAQNHQEKVRLGRSSELQREAIARVLLQINKTIEDKEVDLSEIVELLSWLNRSNSALCEVFSNVSDQFPKVEKQLAQIAKISQENKPEKLDIGKIIQANNQGLADLGTMIVKLAEFIKKNRPEFPKEIGIKGPVEIAKPSWWKPFEFSWTPLQEFWQKIKSHTFSVKIENQTKIELPEIPKLPTTKDGRIKVEVDRVGGGGGGNPFAFGKDGAILVKDGDLDATLLSVLTQLQEVGANTDTLEQLLGDIKGLVDELETNTTGLATEGKQDDSIAKLAEILANLPLNEVGRLKTSNLPADITPVTGSITGNAQTIPVPTDRVSNVMAHCFGTFSTINCTFEGSLNSTNGVDGNWFTIQAVRTSANTVETTTGNLSAAPAYGWELSVNALKYIRVRSTAYTSGTQNWVFSLGSYATEPIPAVQSHAVTLTTTSVGASTSAVGFSQFRNVALSNTDIQIKATAGKIYSWSIKNPHATDTAWVHFYNATTANVVVGTTVPVWSMEVPAGQTIKDFLTVPVQMATAITIAVTTSHDHTVTTAPTTPLIAFVGYI